MPYRIKLPNKPAKEIRRIALEQVQGGLGEIDDAALAVPQKIHQVRKRCKKIRGLIRLIRDGSPEVYEQENSWFRETAQPLSALRDRDVLQESFDAVMETFDEQLNRDAFVAIRHRLKNDHQPVKDESVDAVAQLADTRDRLLAAEKRIKRWKLDLKGSEILGGYARTYKRARKARRQAASLATAEAYHEWRTRAKYHWYHTRILRDVWPAVTEQRGEQLSQLADWLGLDHDLAVLASTIDESTEDFGERRDVEVFLAALQTRRRELEKEAQYLGQLLFAEDADEHAKRFARYWEIWKHGG